MMKMVVMMVIMIVIVKVVITVPQKGSTKRGSKKILCFSDLKVTFG